jgi:serine/threonine protein phosphatase PrpC
MRWSAAFTTHPGRRSENQDAFLSAHPFYGVFDGHGTDGLRISSKARDLFQAMGFERLSEVKENPEKTLRQIFVDVHEAIVDDKSMDTYLAGTTACVAYLDDHSITVAHVGDSKALLVYDMAAMSDGGLPFRLLAA